MSDTSKQPETADRLAKVIARAGLCSRRDAEGWIADGRVAVNGKTVLTPAFNVTSRDKIEVDGLPLAARQGTRVWLYNKPAGLVVTEKDPEGRPTIFEELDRKGLPRVLTVGRLDINTEGLLLLTNDGGLKRVLELPSTGWLRRYRVRAFGQVTQAQLDSLKHGIAVDGVQYGPITATLEREQGSNVWMVLGLREGKNREVKNVLGSLGLEVNRLIRISYGPFQLGDLPEGGVEMVKSRMLRDQLGKKLAESAGVDFESEAPDMVQPAPRDDRPVRSPRDRAPLRPRPAGRDAGPRGSRDDREERPVRVRRVHFENDEGRAPEAYEPKGPGRQRADRDDQPARSFGRPAARSDRGDRPDRGEGRRPDGDRPKRDFGDRPRRDFGDRPARGPRPEGRFEDRPKRAFGDKPARGNFGDRPKRDFGDKPARGGFSDRPKRDFGDRSQRPYGDKPARGPRPEGRSEGRPPRRDGAPGGKPFGDRKPFAGKRDGAKPFGDRPQGGRPGGKPFGGKPGARPASGRPSGNRPTGGRPAGGRPTGPRKPRG
ncbi:pseudouridine synthase [Devosia sp. XK-2]|uniref:pseudouridine synthase n=1 Tax=Devosia sp. XK-2 TaxID=3126689 RepID=UPI0030D268B2